VYSATSTNAYGHIALIDINNKFYDQNGIKKLEVAYRDNVRAGYVCILRPKNQAKLFENMQATVTTNELKTLARNTNLRNEPNTNASKVLYLANTTLFVTQSAVTKSDGFVWDKVRIRTNNREGYMINQNYK